MRSRVALPLILASALLAACGTRAAPDSGEEQLNSAEREALLNAVEEHPSLQNEDLAGPPIDVPTTIPPPAASGMAEHEHMDGMNMDQPAPADANAQAPQSNEQSPPTN